MKTMHVKAYRAATVSASRGVGLIEVLIAIVIFGIASVAASAAAISRQGAEQRFTLDMAVGLLGLRGEV